MLNRLTKSVLSVCFFVLSVQAGIVRAETGENNYLLECLGCHAADGGGTVESVPTLKGHMAEFLLVPGGREFLVRVPGSSQSPLSDEELTETLNWMLNEFGPAEIVKQHPAYSVSEVSEWRKNPLINVKETRAVLTNQIQALPKSF